MCEYCRDNDDKKFIIAGYFSNSNKPDEEYAVDLWTYKNNLALFIHKALEPGYIELPTIKINYCPMCGRKLDEGEAE